MRPQLWFFRLYRPYGRDFFWMTVHFILKSSCVWLSPIIMAQLIDLASSHQENRLAWASFWAILQLLLVVVNFPTALLSMRFLSRLARGLSRDLRLQVCSKIHQLSYLQQEKFRTGKLQSKAIHDIEILEQFPRIFLNQILSTALSLAIIIVSIVMRAPKAMIVFAALIPVGVFLRMYFIEKIQDSSTAYRQSFEQMSVSLHNFLSMNVITKAHGLEHFAVQQMRPKIGRVFTKGHRFDMEAEKLGASSFVSFTLIQMIFLFISVYACMQGEITVGDIVMFNAFFASISGSLMGLVNIFPALSQMQEASLSLDELMQLPIESDEDGLPLGTVVGEIEFQNVSFRYPGTDRDAVCHLTFRARPGQALAFVGPSGCGKSTIMSLILGLIHPTEGQITIDGIELKAIRTSDYRRTVGVVTQDTVLLAGTVFENVAYGLPAASESEVIEALRQAEALDFVQALPSGLRCNLGEDGIRLSGGQKQRIALARALMRNPRILVLDEATSAVDIEIEGRLQDTLHRIARTRTTFIVSHRAPSIVNCEQIIVFDQGLEKARGRHLELLNRSHFYRQLTGSQDTHYQKQMS